MGLTLFEFVWALAFYVFVAALVWWFVRKVSPAISMSRLLKCDKATAQMVLSYIQERGISWHKFLDLHYAALGGLTPMFAYPGQFVALWGETRLATIAILNKKLLTPDTDCDQFVALVIAEIVASRGGGKSEEFRASFHDGQVTISPEDQILF